MIRFSRREDFSVVIVYTLAKKYKKELVPISEISKEYDISPLFLRNIANDLKHAGIIKAVEGKNGGYFLSSDPKTMKMGRILKIFSDNDHITCCPGVSKNKRSCPKKNYCVAEKVWRKLNKEYLDKIYAMTLNEFINYNSTQSNYINKT